MGMRQNIRKLLKEALGVPEGIIDESHRLYDILMEKFMEEDPDSTETEYDFDIDETFTIGKNNDYVISNVTFKLEVYPISRVTEPTIIAFAFGNAHRVEVNKGVRLIGAPSDSIKLMCKVAVPDEWSFEDVVHLFQRQKEKIISSFAHELKHAYDAFKKPVQSPYRVSMYGAYANTQLGLKPVDRFINNLYYIHAIETLVRPSEVGSLMAQKGITQKDFLNFLTNDETYQKLKEISNFSVEKLKEELKDYIPEIDQVFEGLNISTDIPVDEKIDRMMEIVYRTIVNIKAETIKNMISSHPIERALNMILPDKHKFFNRLIERISRFPSYKEFFDYEEKMFKFTARKVMKKLGKLYAMANVNENSILDWDLYQQINKNAFRGFVKDSKYIKKKR